MKREENAATMEDTHMKRLILCLLFVLGLFLAGCEQFEGHERGERVRLSDETQQIDVTVVQ